MRRTLLLVLVAALSGTVGGFVAGWAATTVHQPGSAYFTDVSAASPHNQDIGYLYEAGVVKGLGGGTYGPALSVTREQMASYAARTAAEAYLLTMCSMDWNYFGGFFMGQTAYNEGRITYEEYVANTAAMAWATGAMSYQMDQLDPNAATAPLAATWQKYF